MDELATTKFAGAALATALFIFGLNEAATAVFGGGGHHGEHDYASLTEWSAETFPGYHVEIAEAVVDTGEPAEALDLGLALASADIAAGETAMRQCAQCHSWNEGGPNGTGPNLHAIMGADIAAKPGYAYSTTLAGLDGNWTYEKMNAWLENPAAFARGNKMSYAGLRSPRRTGERIDIIAYLASQTPNAPPFPAPLASPEPEAAAGPEVPADPAEAGEEATDAVPDASAGTPADPPAEPI